MAVMAVNAIGRLMEIRKMAGGAASGSGPWIGPKGPLWTSP